MPGTAGRVRDPVHGYIPFTGIERTLFDHPVAQRLRTISQSAAAHLVFPEMRVSRFAHSLGAMHLASRFFAAILRNAEGPEHSQILAACRELVAANSGLGLGDAEQAIVSERALVAGPELPRADRAAVLFVEQGLRLASLAHDLGHLPFSHDFETALEARLRADQSLRDRLAPLFAAGVRGDKIHERVGYALAATVQQRIFNEELVGTPSAKVAEVSLLVARAILDAPAAPELEDDPTRAVLSWLHSLVDGQIDVDRADYVLRDVRAYALSAAVYDLDRPSRRQPGTDPHRGWTGTRNGHSAARRQRRRVLLRGSLPDVRLGDLPSQDPAGCGGTARCHLDGCRGRSSGPATVQ